LIFNSSNKNNKKKNKTKTKNKKIKKIKIIQKKKIQIFKKKTLFFYTTNFTPIKIAVHAFIWLALLLKGNMGTN